MYKSTLTGEAMFGLRESSAMIGIKVRTIREWIRLGKIHAIQDSRTRRWYVSESEIERKRIKKDD